MKCWKCEQELAEGTGICPYCGKEQKRPVPVTEIGRALREVYDRYGARDVLGNSVFLVNGLGDLLEDSKELRTKLKMAMDAGAGRMYLEQLNIGTPDSNFDKRVNRLLTEGAGLKDSVAEELAGYLDEMIGWRSAVRSQTKLNVYNQSSRQKTGRIKPGLDEVDRNTPQVSVKQKIGWSGLYAYEKMTVFCIIILVLSFFLDEEKYHDTSSAVRYMILVMPLLQSFKVKKDKLRESSAGFPNALAFILLFLAVVLAADCFQRQKLISALSNNSGETAYAGLLWQEEMVFTDVTFCGTAVLLYLRMLRLRKLEKDHRRT